jgi:hypothetical protein
MKKRTVSNPERFNPKRRICTTVDPDDLKKIAGSIRYGGNPEHKRDQGDFNLVPPSQPRPDSTLCDVVKIFSRHEAERLLRAGVERGLISVQKRNGYPQNIWSVTGDGYPLEAQLENAIKGIYHGYPMPENDAFRDKVLDLWNKHE